MLKGENSSKGREGAGLGRGGGLQVLLGDVVVLGRVPLVGHPAAGAVRGLGGSAPALLLGEGRRRVCRLPRGQGPLQLGTAANRQLERMAKKRRPRLPQGLRQRAKVTGHLLRYLVHVREVFLEEFVVGVILICVQDRKDASSGTRPRRRKWPPPAWAQPWPSGWDTTVSPTSPRRPLLY